MNCSPAALGFGRSQADLVRFQFGLGALTRYTRFFKQKDAVENFLNREVKAGRMDLSAAQRGIAEDWTQFLAAAKKAGVK